MYVFMYVNIYIYMSIDIYSLHIIQINWPSVG